MGVLVRIVYWTIMFRVWNTQEDGQRVTTCQFLHCDYEGPVFMVFRFDDENWKTCIRHGKIITKNGHSFEWENDKKWLFSPVFARGTQL